MKNNPNQSRNYDLESRYILSLLEGGSKVSMSFGGGKPIEFNSNADNQTRLHDVLSTELKSTVFIETNTAQGIELIKNLLAVPDTRVKSGIVSGAKSIVQQIMHPQSYNLQGMYWFNYIEFLNQYEFIATHTYTNADRQLKNAIVFVRPFGFDSTFKVLLDFEEHEVYEAVEKAKALLPTVDYREVAEKDKSVCPTHLDVYSIDELIPPFDFVRRVEKIDEQNRLSMFLECVKKVDKGEHYKMHPEAIELCKGVKRADLVGYEAPYSIDLTTPVFIGQWYVQVYYLDCFNEAKYFKVRLENDSKEHIISAVKQAFETVKADKDLSVRYKEALPAICEWWANKTFNNVFPQASSKDSFSAHELLSDALLISLQKQQNKSTGAKADKFKEDLSTSIINHIDKLILENTAKGFYTINHYVSCSLRLATDYSAIDEPLQEMERLGYALPAKCHTRFDYDKGKFEAKAGYGGKTEEITF